MKTCSKNLLLVTILATLVVPAAAGKSSSAPKAAQKSTATGKTTTKHVAKHSKSGSIAAGEAASLQQETGNGDPRGMREENRGRVTSAKGVKSHHSNQVAKGTHSGKGNAVASSHRKSATLQNASQSSHKAGLKTSQLTTGKASRAQAKNVSMQHEVAGKGKKYPARPATADPEKDPANKTSHSPTLKPNNARMF